VYRKKNRDRQVSNRETMRMRHRDGQRTQGSETREIMVERDIFRRRTVNLKQQKQREWYKEKQAEEE
jgi:hypothetical protein